MGQLRINYPTKVETLERTEAARAIARWDPDWRQHVWNVDLVEFLSKFTYAFSYSNGTGWKDGPKAYDYKDFDLEFRKWYEVTYPLPEGYVKWQPTCEFCGELLDIGKETLHVKQWCIGRWAYLLDTRWTYPFGVWPATYAERYRREKEVTAEIKAFGFRVPGPYWKHLLQPAEQVLLDAGVFNDGKPYWWCRYWVARERKRAIKSYSRIHHLEKQGYSYYNGRGSLVCSAKKIEDKWFAFTPQRDKLPHGFQKPSYAVAFYYPAPDTMLHLLRKYVYESRWPLVGPKARKLYRTKMRLAS